MDLGGYLLFSGIKNFHSEIFAAKYDFEIVATLLGDNAKLQSWLSIANCEETLG